MYVMDGQQRIVTLCLLFAAARERLLGEPATHGLAREVEAMLKQVCGQPGRACWPPQQAAVGRAAS